MKSFWLITPQIQKNMHGVIEPLSKSVWIGKVAWQSKIKVSVQMHIPENGHYWTISKRSRNSIRKGLITIFWHFWKNGLPEWSNKTFVHILFSLIRPQRSNKHRFTNTVAQQFFCKFSKSLATRLFANDFLSLQWTGEARREIDF